MDPTIVASCTYPHRSDIPLPTFSWTGYGTTTRSRSATRSPGRSSSGSFSKSAPAALSQSPSRSRPPVQHSPSPSPSPVPLAATEGNCGLLSDGKGGGYGVSCLDNLCCSQYGACSWFNPPPAIHLQLRFELRTPTLSSHCHRDPLQPPPSESGLSSRLHSVFPAAP